MTKERITAYATFDPAAPDVMKIVSINKDQTNASLNVGFSIRHTRQFGHYDAWQVSGGVRSCVGPTQVASNVPITGTNAFNASLPKQSITVFVLKP
jgi:O-glycosyl hydrolase